MSAWTWIVAGAIAAVALAMIAGKTRDAFARPGTLKLGTPRVTVDPDLTPAPCPRPPLAHPSPDPAAGGPPHRTRVDLGQLTPPPERAP